jgi:hypothetical protein
VLKTVIENGLDWEAGDTHSVGGWSGVSFFRRTIFRPAILRDSQQTVVPANL